MEVKKKKLNIYLDNCCFNRPYDDQTQLRIEIETKAKLFIQSLVADDKVSLTTSSMLKYENGKNPFVERRLAILSFVEKYVASPLKTDETIKNLAKSLAVRGLHPKDATHLAFAISGACDYFVTTDDRILKTDAKINDIKIITPQDFLKIWEDYENDD